MTRSRQKINQGSKAGKTKSFTYDNSGLFNIALWKNLAAKKSRWSSLQLDGYEKIMHLVLDT